jgi:hypothetical protein
MKNKIGKIIGFVLGVLLAFLTIAILSHFHPDEDFAGITIFSLLISGLFFSFVGSLLQNYFINNKIQDL